MNILLNSWKMPTHHVVISSATIISSLRIKAVNEMETMCRNSFSKRTKDIIMMAAPEAAMKFCHRVVGMIKLTLVDTDHQPLKKCFV